MTLIAYLFALFLGVSYAHEGHHHGEVTSPAKQAPAAPDVRAVYSEINRDYESGVKSIFDRKCAACHSISVEAPWYAKVPGVGWIVKSDRSEAKKHLEISKGFPFAGHGSVEEDLEAIQESVTKNTMPTFLYKLAHPSSGITTEEKSTILEWIKTSKEKLSSASKEEVHK